MSAPRPEWSSSPPAGRTTGPGVPLPGHFLPGARPPAGPPPELVGHPGPPVPPAPAGWPVPPPAVRPQEGRPFALVTSAVLTVTAGVQVALLVAFLWLVLYAGASAFDYREPTEAALYHLLNRGHLALQQGLWLPLIGFPLAAAVVGFLLPLRAAWPRVAATVLGVAATAWMVVWRSDALQWVLVPAGYVALCVLLLWTPGVTRWLRTRPRTQETPR